LFMEVLLVSGNLASLAATCEVSSSKVNPPGITQLSEVPGNM